MKLKIYLALILIIGHLSEVRAQNRAESKTVTLNQTARLMLPQEAQKISSDQARSFAIGEGRKESRFIITSYPFNYRIDGMLLGIADHKKPIDVNYLKDAANGIRILYEKAGMKPVIRQEKINNNSLLLIEAEENILSSIGFFLVNEMRTASLSGGIEAKIPDKTRAKKLITENVKNCPVLLK